jgi:hypothetical protein
MTIQLTTLTVRVLNASGKDMFEHPRFLRVVTSAPMTGKLAVARHGKGLIVTGIAAPDAVIVDGTALRVDLKDTRAAKPSDIGQPEKRPTTKTPPAIPSDLPALIAKYTGTIAKRGAVFIENALTHTKDVVKREAMEIALGRKPAPTVEASKAKKAATKRTPAPVLPAERAPSAVNVADLTKALTESPEAAMAFLAKALANAGK